MMCAAPDLAECTFDKVIFSGCDRASLSTHTSLRNLQLYNADILRCLELPALESVSISDFSITRGQFLDFLTRSSAPLQSLNMDMGWLKRQPEEWSIDQVESLWRLVPLLNDLTIKKHPSDVPAWVGQNFVDRLKAGITATLRELVADGMEVHMGTEDNNWV
ncbi:hypothetical protein C8J57DRAFT_1254610 [Mycena rebaudengoi]|nr:hypothetical protein C8J57DRAFT_1254610 [Mycena rebaudengoi]